MSELLQYYLDSQGTDELKKEIVEIYAGLLDFMDRSKAINILEIGAGKVGASIKMWRKYFYNANVFSFDPFFLEDQEVTPKELKSLNIVPIIGNQLSRQDLRIAASQIVEATGTGIDIVIDDAAHMPDTVQISLGVLFPFLNASGIYFVEDLNTTLRRAMDIDSVNKNLEVLDTQGKMSLRHVDDVHLFDAVNSFAQKGEWPSKSLTEPEKNYLASNIAYANIIGKNVEFENNRTWRRKYPNGLDAKSDEKVYTSFHLPHVGVLRKTSYAGYEPAIEYKEVQNA